MLEGLRDLVDLSRLDSELTALEEERTALPGKLAACAEERAAAEQRLEAAREALAETEQAQRRAEADAQDHEAERVRLEGQQHQVKTNEAYRALLAEIDRAREAVSDAETRILEAMEGIEEAKSAYTSLEEQVRSVVGRIEARVREHEERAKVLDAEIDALRARRSEHAAAIEGELVARYEKIGTRRRPAVAIVSRETCQGCRVGIPPQKYIEILKGEQIVTCGSCGRILIDENQLRESS